MKNQHGRLWGVSILLALCLCLLLDSARPLVFASDDDRGSGYPASGYPQSGPPTSGQGGSCGATGGADFSDPSKMPDPATAMAELRKTDPALADKMEKLMQDAKGIADEAARKAKESQKQ